MAAVALCVAIGGQTASAGQAVYPTFFTKFKFESGKFSGKINSSKGSCVKDRKIVLYRKKDGDRKKIGSDSTNGEGKFAIGTGGGAPKNGKYFAQAKETGAGHGGTCLEESSAKVTIG
jgi:hypothetical protein